MAKRSRKKVPMKTGTMVKAIQSLGIELEKAYKSRRRLVASWPKKRIMQERAKLTKQFLVGRIEIRDLVHSLVFTDKEIMLLSEEKAAMRARASRARRESFHRLFFEGFKASLKREHSNWSEEQVLKEIERQLKPKKNG